MAWLQVIQLVIKLAASVSEYLGRKQLIDAGEAKAISEGLHATIANIQKAKAASKEVSANPNGDYAGGVRSKYTRTDE